MYLINGIHWNISWKKCMKALNYVAANLNKLCRICIDWLLSYFSSRLGSHNVYTTAVTQWVWDLVKANLSRLNINNNAMGNQTTTAYNMWSSGR